MKVRAIFGPPGTGKTRTLVDIAKKEAEADARGVMYLSYTKAAAQEATSRVAVGGTIKPSTLHSFAFNALNLNRASVVDPKKLAEFGAATGIPFKGSEKGSDELQEGDEYTTVLQFANNRIIDPMDAYDRFGRPGTEHRFKYFLESYVAWKGTYGYVDYDDMLRLFNQAPFVNRAAEVVLLDEAQDCTPLQWLSFIRICDNAKRVYLAGDDDQAIYEWSGAHPHGMIDFAEEHDGEVTVLNKSYRVPRHPHEFVHKVILPQIERRVEKKFAPRDGDGTIKRMGDFSNVDIRRLEKSGGMILARDRFRVREIEKDLNRQMIPYDVLGGFSPWTNKLAQDLRAGKKVDIPPWWVEFYRQADLTLPVRLTLSTIHQAKGREANNVVIDLQMPARVLASLYLNRDAELRVWYVALTRVAKNLLICGENPLI